jgi:DNA-binding SARP family transcriptional activator
VWVRLLGAVDVSVDGAVRPVHGLRRRAVLATLALRQGEVVSSDQLMDVVWGQAAPVTALNTLQSHVSHLRRVMGSKAAILARPPGYAIGPGAEPTDVQAAEELIRRGMQSADHAQRARDLHTALALWRGPSLADIAGLPWLEEQAARLDHLRQQASQAWLETRLNLGEHLQVVPDLEQLARDRPFDEPIHHLLMLALYRCGRQTDALDTYQRLQRSLDAELGIRPGQPLRDLEVAILRQDPALHRPGPAAARTATPAPPVPMQLPPPTQAFAGRGTELADLDALLPRAAEPGPTAVVITAVSGTAGIGKTTLAMYWAHRVADRFPDGQLYVNLRGFDPAGTLVDPADAVRGFLHALGVPADRIPAGLDERTALYRSVLAGRRVLVVLDNARDAAQVRPLLPSTAGCLALVTSRNRLSPLIAVEGAHPITLDLLPTPDATRLTCGRCWRS